jgi:predicted N-formylglutamate amidohydrolase
VIHLSSHSFTPELHGKIRNADIGLLYDPRRPGEVALCERWKAAFKLCAPDLAVRRNYPYAGKNDGLTAWFRRRLSPENYIGIEIEINQKHIRQADQDWTDLRKLVIKSLRTALASA